MNKENSQHLAYTIKRRGNTLVNLLEEYDLSPSEKRIARIQEEIDVIEESLTQLKKEVLN